jgi:hypothetical protein
MHIGGGQAGIDLLSPIPRSIADFRAHVHLVAVEAPVNIVNEQWRTAARSQKTPRRLWRRMINMRQNAGAIEQTGGCCGA